MRVAAGRVAVALVATALLAACGGPSSSSSASSPKPSPSPSPSPVRIATVDACALANATDASTAAGATLTQIPTGAPAGAQASICVFGNTAGNSQAAVLIIASAYPDQQTADAVDAQQLAAAFGGQFGITGISNAKVVTGIGDKAVEYTATSASGGGMGMFVFKANVVMFIIVSPASDPAKIETLARTCVANFDKATHT